MRAVSLFALALLVAGCTANTATRLENAPLTPPGLADGAAQVDPLIVGDRLMAAGEHELALRSYLRAGNDRGMTPEVLEALGSANLRLGRLGQAEDLLRQVITAEPRRAGAWNNLGVVLMETGEYGEARRSFETAFALSSGEHPEIRENLRVALAKMENPSYSENNTSAFSLVRRGNGVFSLSHEP